MFWFNTIRELKRQVEGLNAINQRRQIKEDCAAGIHQWQLLHTDSASPYTRCIHCWKTPEKPV